MEDNSFKWLCGVVIVGIICMFSLCLFMSRSSGSMTTLKHSGHSYIVLTNNSNVAMCHDPDCQCQKAER